jgi:hypothetical protein
LALSVGIFPYVLKLLGSKLKELQPILVFIWAKILAVDPVWTKQLIIDLFRCPKYESVWFIAFDSPALMGQ